MKWGELELHRISDGEIWLDGGAMFGIVPKPLWQRQKSSDDRNRVCLGLNCLLIQSDQQNILIDTGCGFKYSQKELEIFNIQHQTSLFQELGQLGLEPEHIDGVINTHLHFDHCGGNTIEQSTEIVPTFPNATYWIRRSEYEEACHPNERTRATYRKENWEALEKTGQIRLVDEDESVIAGVELVSTPGHTLGHQSVRIDSGGRTLFYIADLCPTAAHIPLPWIMAYDLYPAVTLETRRQIYGKAIEEEWLIFFEHDPDCLCGTLKERDGQLELQAEDWSTL